MLTQRAEETHLGPAYASRAVVIALPTLCFLGALSTDVTYWRTSDIQWANFSAWLLAIGTLLGGFSLIAEMVHLVARRRASLGWWGVGVLALALAVALANNFIHARDGWTSVVPSGLILSAITVGLMIAASAIIAKFDRVEGGELP